MAKKISNLFTVYNNCLAEISLSNADFNSLVNKLDTSINALVKDFQKTFKDDFDFVVFVLNTGTAQPAGSLYGYYQSLDVRVPSRTQRLMGYQFFPYTAGLLSGPGLHELFHEWGSVNAIPNTIDTTDKSHWGVSSVGGQLGGFDVETLQKDSAGVYSASVKTVYPLTGATVSQASECEKISSTNLRNFGTNANGGNAVPYADLELYAMGLLPSAQLTSVLVADNPRASAAHYNLNDPKKSYFLADGFSAYGETQIRSRMGKYAPVVNNGQRDFRFATVVITNPSGLSESARLAYLDQLDVMSARSEHQKLKTRYSVAGNSNFTSVECLTGQNFYTATKGKATVSVGGLIDSLIN